MKKLSLLIIASLLTIIVKAQSVGIGTTSPDPAAQLDVMSTTKGFLPPRMTYVQRNAIVSPVAGLLIYCTDCDELQVYNGVIWKNINGVAAALPSGYPSVTICNQVWMGKNLSVSTYRNGQTIPQVTDPTIWGSITVGAWCWYNNDSATYSGYGKLYNWYAVNDPRGLAPAGWHISNDAEWLVLSACLGDMNAGGLMKESDTTHWLSPNTGADNRSGFSGLPGGLRNGEGNFFNIGTNGYWWTSTADTDIYARAHGLSYNSANLGANGYTMPLGFSIRCVRD